MTSIARVESSLIKEIDLVLVVMARVRELSRSWVIYSLCAFYRMLARFVPCVHAVSIAAAIGDQLLYLSMNYLREGVNIGRRASGIEAACGRSLSTMIGDTRVQLNRSSGERRTSES